MVALAETTHATLATSWDSDTLSTVIADANANGVTVSHTFTDLDPAGINGVDVRLNISGGYNGDLYGYLVLQNANGSSATAILLNRVGTSGSDPFGSTGSGFNVTLSDGGSADIHGATGNPTGTWLADQYAGANSLNSTFSGMTANGTWTLFLADLSAGGGQSTLLGWGLDVSVVPEPTTWGLVMFGGGLAIAGIFRIRIVQRKISRKMSNWWSALEAWVNAV